MLCIRSRISELAKENGTTNETPTTNFDSQQMTFPFVVNNLMLERRILDFFAKVSIGNVLLSRTSQLDKYNHFQIIRVQDNIRLFRGTDLLLFCSESKESTKFSERRD